MEVLNGRLHPEITTPEEWGANICLFLRQAVKGLNVIHEDSGYILGKSNDKQWNRLIREVLDSTGR